MSTYRILHCLRAPVGGLFRHVRDLIAGQVERGHQIGLICDSRTGGAPAEEALEQLGESLVLGIHKLPMSRGVGPADYLAYRKILHIARSLTGAHVIHGHGAKGGAYARLVAHTLKQENKPLPAFYTPHGGSLHYRRTSLRGQLYLGLERKLAAMTDGLIFESEFSARTYANKVSASTCEYRVIPNGLRPEEFYQVVVDTDAADFLFIGELRAIKGVDVLIQALSRLRRTHATRTLIVGAGPDGRRFERMARRHRLGARIRFMPPMPARAAFARARCLVVPSRAESLPYIVLEAAAAQMPMIVTAAGGIPEIVAGADMPIVEPNSVAALRQQLAAFLDNPAPFAERANVLQQIVSERYDAAKMIQAVLDFYHDRITAPTDRPEV